MEKENEILRHLPRGKKSMSDISGYSYISLLRKGKKASVYRGIRDRDHQCVLLKVLTSQSPSIIDHASFLHQYDFYSQLKMKEIVTPIEVEQLGNTYALVYRDPGGMLLKEYIKIHRPRISEFLQISLQLAEKLIVLHEQNISITILSPAHIFIHPEKLDVQFFDIGGAEEDDEIYDIYHSPEQSAQINPSSSHLSDIYSLGVIFYELLTGRLPFDVDSDFEWMHAHMTKKVIHPSERRQDVPNVVSDIVLKMLTKAPEDRYQSVFGLKEDIFHCLKMLEQNGTVQSFQIARYDFSSQFQITSKLYGREKEIQSLMEELKMVRFGLTKMVLISGSAGTGKTALVNEIEKLCAKENGYFVSAKFDQFQRDIPYEPFIRGFRQLINQLLAESREELQRWKRELLEHLGSGAAVITEVIPELELLIGKQDAVPLLPSSQSKLRFHWAFRRFMQTFAKKSHPLLFFLDDLQWCDTASLELLQSILNDPEFESLLIIGAYRDDEMKEGHPFLTKLKEMKRSKENIREFPLGMLNVDHINQIIAETLGCSPDDVRELAIVLYEKTAGNPLFFKQLFQTIYDEKFLWCNLKRGKWEWNLNKVKEQPEYDEMIGFIVSKIEKLSPLTRKLILTASCLGHRFDFQFLSFLHDGINTEKMTDALSEAVQEGMIIQVSDQGRYQFIHDRVQQAAYSLLDQRKKQEIHYKAGQFLFKRTSKEEHEKFFEMINHLNLGRRFIQHPERKADLAELNWSAGEKAKNAALFDQALNYFQTGIELLPENYWESCYELSYKLFLGKGESEYLNGLFRDSERTFNEMLTYAKTKEDQLKVYNMKSLLFSHQQQFEKAVEAGLKGLRLFGWKLPQHPGKFKVLFVMILTKTALRGRSAADLTALPTMTDRNKRLLMEILINLNRASYQYDQYLVSILMLRALRLTLRHGMTDVSALAYNNYALFLSAGFQDYEGSFQFGQLALHTATRFQSKHLMGRVDFVFGTFVNHWKKTMEDNLFYIKRSQKHCVESGNLHLAGESSSFLIITMLIKGEPLNQLLVEIEKQLEFVLQIKLEHSIKFLKAVKSWLQCLVHLNAKFTMYEERENLDESSVIVYDTIQLKIAFLLKEDELAYQLAVRLEKLVKKSLLLIISPEFYFYHSLLLIRRCEQKDRKNMKIVKKQLKRALNQFKKWSEHCPDNFRHKQQLLLAEWDRLQKKETEAMKWYDEAIHSAKTSSDIQIEALANELAGDFYAKKGMHRIAQTYLREAHRCYRLWGAHNKAEQLQHDYPEFTLIEETNQTKNDHKSMITWEGTKRTKGEERGLSAIIQAAASLSEDMNLEQLLGKLLMLIARFKGAEKVCFIRPNGKETVFSIEKVISTHGETNEMDQNVGENIPISVIQYVHRIKETIKLQDAVNDFTFSKDHYIQKNKVRSVLCFPVVQQKTVKGIFYLENNQLKNAFESENMEVLTTIASQAVYVLELLYSFGKETKIAVEKKAETIKNELVDPLTERELEVLNLVSIGLTNKEIAERLGLAVGTVKVHLNNIFSKLQVNRRTKAVVQAKELNLL
ncbi:AAA family ATPase [Aeribacillus pallidus]